jgi:predicted HD phosphohydrolase
VGAASLDELLDLLAASAAADDEESVTILAHQLQTAGLLRVRCPSDVELQVAGLVHDLGWLHGGHPHDVSGAALVRDLLGDRVATLVAGHVDAKRYLVTVEPDYGARLSVRSVATLGFQGEAMDTGEVAAFERHPEFAALVALRRADDEAKVPGLTVAGLDTWRAPLTSCVSH